MNFEKIIAENHFKTNCVIGLYILIFVLIGLLVDVIQINAPSLGYGLFVLLSFQVFPLVGVSLALVGVLVVWYVMNHFDGVLLSGDAYQEIPIRGSSPIERKLNAMLDRLLHAAKLDFRPRLYILDAPHANAFASGWNPQNSMIVLTDGLIQNLRDDEIEAVMAHELCHIIHGDIRLTLMVGILSNIMLLVVNYAVFFLLGGSRDRGANAARMILFILQLVLPLVTIILQMFLSRTREYMADSGAAYLMQNNQPMIRALQRIEQISNQPTIMDNPTRKVSYIFSPQELFSTHPSIPHRIKSLMRM